MSKVYAKMIEAKEKYVKFYSSEKRGYYKSIALQNLLSEHDHLTIWYVAKRMVMDSFNNKIISNFKVGYISYLSLKQKKVFKYQV